MVDFLWFWPVFGGILGGLVDVWWISCRFLVGFLISCRGFCGSGRFSMEFWVVWWISIADFLSVSGGLCGSGRFSVEFWVVMVGKRF